MTLMFDLSFTARTVLLGATLLGIVGGALGSFALLRRQSLLGDALAHAALPGVCLGYYLTGSKNPLPLFLGALFAGIVGALCILVIVRNSRLKQDTAIGIVLSVFFGAGIVLLTHIQKLPLGNQSGLDKFLFGQAATLLPRDVMIMAVLGGIVLLLVLVFFKELRVLTFDPEFGASLGFPMRGLEVFLTVLLVTVVVVGLQTVGVVLIVATLITPAAAARQWTDRLGIMVLLAAAIGGFSGATGALISASWARLPTGPVIVLVASVILLVSLLFAPQRGMLWATLRERAVAARIRRENLLKDLYRWGENAGGTWSEPVTTALVMGFRGHSRQQLTRVARRLDRKGLLSWTDAGITLEPEGLEQAQRIVRRHRLWELYLTRRLELAEDHVHRDAEEMEHALTEETEARLDALLGYPTVDPHGRPIPRPTSGPSPERGAA